MLKMTKSKKGFTLIELIVVIAILGVLAMLVVPKLSGFKASADNRVNEVNAKLLSNVAQMYAATHDGAYPNSAGWTATFSTMDEANAFGLLSESISIQPAGSSSVFTYDQAAGKVTAPASGGGGPVIPPAPTFAIGTGSHSNEILASNCTAGATIRLYWYSDATDNTPTEVTTTGIPYTLGASETSHYFAGTMSGYWYTATQTVNEVQSPESARVHR